MHAHSPFLHTSGTEIKNKQYFRPSKRRFFLTSLQGCIHGVSAMLCILYFQPGSTCNKSLSLRKPNASILIALLCLLLPLGAQAGEVKVFAAASLTDVLTELGQSYQKVTPATTIKNSFASSATLAKQIENGANSDLFISADQDWADYLAKRNLLISNSRKNLLANELVLIAPLGTSPKIEMQKGFDFAKSFSGKLCTGDPASVPVGKYAKQALDYFNWWQAIEARIVGTEDVRTALVFVARGECPLGIVYNTDAKASQKVTLVASFPAASHLPIIYPGALTAKASDEAHKFWQFLQSPAAAEVFKRYGFRTEF